MDDYIYVFVTSYSNNHEEEGRKVTDKLEQGYTIISAVGDSNEYVHYILKAPKKGKS